MAWTRIQNFIERLNSITNFGSLISGVAFSIAGAITTGWIASLTDWIAAYGLSAGGLPAFLV